MGVYVTCTPLRMQCAYIHTHIHTYVYTTVSAELYLIPYTWQSVTAQEIGATDFKNYTGDCWSVINTEVQNATDINDCCKYKYQILDKFCAVQPEVRCGHCIYVHVCKCYRSMCFSYSSPNDYLVSKLIGWLLVKHHLETVQYYKPGISCLATMWYAYTCIAIYMSS